jgi:hypothetical protein
VVGVAYVAFVVDAYARRILGWRVAATMATSMVLDAHHTSHLDPTGDIDLKGVVHHIDRGAQPGFKGSLQHCLVRVSVDEVTVVIAEKPTVGASSESGKAIREEDPNFTSEEIQPPEVSGPGSSNRG